MNDAVRDDPYRIMAGRPGWEPPERRARPPRPAGPSMGPRGVHPMVSDYLKTLKKRLRWVPKRRKASYMMEVGGHIEEIASTVSGSEERRYSVAIQRFGEPGVVAREFVGAYGYGRKYLVVMSMIGFFLTLFTIPVRIPLQPETDALCTGVPVLMTILVFIHIIRVSVRAGRRTGAIVGTVCGTSHILAFLLLLAMLNSVPEVSGQISVPGGVVAGVALVSLLMALSGYLPGRTLQRYRVN